MRKSALIPQPIIPFCRGRAFAPISRNSLRQSRYANALPSSLLPIIYDCGLGIVDEWFEVLGGLGWSVMSEVLGRALPYWVDLKIDRLWR
jgi:hypothetical protein